jgi:beta-N-acetylhexosaminidase
LSADAVLRRLADAILIPPFPGVTAPRWLLSALSDGLAGVTLFGPNVAGPAQLAALTAALRSAAGDAIIAIDEEGGDVTRLGYATGSPYPGNAALGAVDDIALTESVHRAIGLDLAATGINVDLAPCLDVLAAPENPVIGTRSFGGDPELVSRHGAAAVRGLQSAGVAACGKHFPGHGSTLLDSHVEVAVISGDMDLVSRRDLPPFRAAIAAGVLAMMPGHLRVPGLTGDLPASLSAAAISLLRDSLGFTGLVISDGLEMRAVSKPFGVPEAAVRAVAAGTDLLCLGRDVTEDGYLATRSALCEAVRSGRVPGSRLEEAASRVALLRARLTTMRTATGPARTGAAPAQADAWVDRAGIGLHAARRALRLTGLRPELTDPVIVEVEPQVNMAAGDAHWGLAQWVPAEASRRIASRPDSAAETTARVLKVAAGRALVLVVRDAHRSVATQDLVMAVLAERPEAVLVEMGLPFWQPPPGTYKSYLATYGASRASSQAAAEFLGLTDP